MSLPRLLAFASTLIGLGLTHPAAATLRPTSPVADSPPTGLYPNFLWDTDTPASPDQSPRFQFQLAADPSFATPLIDDTSPLARYVPAARRLRPGATYHWRVRRLDTPDSSDADWSPPASFAVADFTQTIIEINDQLTVPEVRAAFARAAAHAPATVRLTSDVFWGHDHDDPLVSLDAAADVWFDGGGHTITVTHPYNRVFHTENCRNVIFSNVTLDFNPLPYVLCEVTGLDPQHNQFTVRTYTDAANPSLELDDPIMQAAQKKHMRVLDRDHPGRVKPGADTYLHEGRQTYLRSYQQDGVRYHVMQLDPATDHVSDLAVGDLMLRVGRGNGRNFLRAATSTDICVDQVDVRASASQFASSIDGSGFIVINSRVSRLPGRYKSITADSLYIRRNRLGPWIENCDFTANGDDAINLHGFGAPLAPTADPHTVRLTHPGDIDLYQSGDPVILWAGDVSAPSPLRSTVTAVDPAVSTVTLAHPTTGLVTDSPATTTSPRLYNRNRSNARFAILRNRITDNARHGIMVSGTDGVILDNHLDGCASSALQLGNNPPEGLGAARILVAGNRISDCGYTRDHVDHDHAMIVLATMARPWTPVPHRLISDVVLRDNHITRSTGPAYFLSGVERIHISDTHYTARPDSDDDAVFARIDHADDITLQSTHLGGHAPDALPIQTGADTSRLELDPVTRPTP